MNKGAQISASRTVLADGIAYEQPAMDDKESASLTTTPATASTLAIPADLLEDDNSNFILIPLLVLLGIIILSALVFLMARNGRRMAHVYCKRKHAPSYALDDDSDSAMEQTAEDFDDPTECLLKGKLQIDSSYDTYQTTRVTANGGTKEIYT